VLASSWLFTKKGTFVCLSANVGNKSSLRLFSLDFRGLNESIFGQDVRLINRTSNWTISGRDFGLPL